MAKQAVSEATRSVRFASSLELPTNSHSLKPHISDIFLNPKGTAIYSDVKIRVFYTP
jgi:hypothetical protein